MSVKSGVGNSVFSRFLQNVPVHLQRTIPARKSTRIAPAESTPCVPKTIDRTPASGTTQPAPGFSSAATSSSVRETTP